MKSGPFPVRFSDTSKAFAHLSDADLRFNYWIFRLMNNPFLTGLSTTMAEWALRFNLPVRWIVKPTIFRVFCGGENVQQSLRAVDNLGKYSVGAILDYSVEGQENEREFAQTEREILDIITMAEHHPHIPVACIKISGIASNKLLEKLSSNDSLNNDERLASALLLKRFERICAEAHRCDVPIYVDAEESWIQGAIDRLVETMMAKYNKEKAIVFQTVQMFRHDRLEYLKQLTQKAEREGFIIGVKIVRGAYLDKENKRAEERGYPTPIQPDKESTDRDYNAALEWSVHHLERIEFCAGTHNEYSCKYLSQLMADKGVPNDHPSIYFSQLYGMSDYMSFNLAAAGYNVSKYLPYGPVKFTLPYLIRRAKENTAIAGQMGKEYQMISEELKRRKQSKRG